MSEKFQLLNKCPVCGSDIDFRALQQYEEIYKITKYGKLASRKKYTSNSEDLKLGYFSCSNYKCNFVTDCKFNSLNHKGIIIQKKDDVFYYAEES